ncbi:DUF1232 domain-containing protein [Oceanobacillus jordanicus]|uniref:DUF1232 domain-containing protein n=1 Tax=Oceanobacillus jordanicus TaxID=2867266 RepID=A0AAW5B8G7_9BACI|nr:DUF1232 domain-containing protein [Oceanobacillus jordanicus]
MTTEFGGFLKKQLQINGLTMRKFSEMTNIETSSISRIINGKRKANIHHLRAFSEALDIPIEELLKVAGYADYSISDNNEEKVEKHIQQLIKVIETSDMDHHEFSIDRLEKQLKNHRQHAMTEEGQETIKEKFKSKIKRIGAAGPFIRQLEEMYEQFTSGNVTIKHQLIMGGALLYFVLTLDLIPDYLFPIGYIDDAIAVQLTVSMLAKQG